MITFYTAMLISYVIQGEVYTQSIWFDSYDQCSYSKSAMYEILKDHQDIHVYCQGTPARSNFHLKPMPRPEGWTYD